MSYLIIDELGSKHWYNDEGQWHREDGPAVEYSDGYKSWWFKDKHIGYSGDGFTQEDFERFLKIKEYW